MGGLLINFDANWYTYLFDDEKRKEYEMDRINVADADYEDYNIGENFDLMEDIALKLPLSNVKRPEWDKSTLAKLGLEDIKAIADIGQCVYSEKELINYASTPLFMVYGKKGVKWER